MKKLNLTIDFVLDNLSINMFADGKGNITIATDTEEITPYFLIDLALENLGIPFNTGEYLYDNNIELTHFEFKLNDLKSVKDDCPVFYKHINELNSRNAKNIG